MNDTSEVEATVTVAADIVRHIVCRANEIGLAAGEWICAEVKPEKCTQEYPRDSASATADMIIYALAVLPLMDLCYIGLCYIHNQFEAFTPARGSNPRLAAVTKELEERLDGQARRESGL